MEAAVAVGLDTLPEDIPAYGRVDLDSVLRAMQPIEERLATASEADRPALLLELGRLRRVFVVDRGSDHAPFAEARPDEFFYNEFSGDYLYTGVHLRELMERYPEHVLADDAAYELTLLPQGGECEGYRPCYIAYVWHAVGPFLQAFPHSPYAPRAVARALEAFETNLAEVADLTVADDFYDPVDLRNLLAEFDATIPGLPPALRERAAALSARIHQRLERRT